jgi:hypothetical protein
MQLGIELLASLLLIRQAAAWAPSIELFLAGVGRVMPTVEKVRRTGTNSGAD